jgi:hypothetical protein
MALFKDFDRDAFLGAFFQQAATGIQESREKAEKYKEQEEAAYERNIALIQQRDLRAKTAASLGKQALDLLPEGANAKAMVKTAMASGVQGVGELVEKLKALHEREGLKAGERLNIFDVEAAISMPHISSIDPSMLDMSLEEFARRTYGAQATAAPVEDKTGVLGKLFGVGAKTRAKEELRKTPGFGGMSIADVNAAARQTEFNQLIPNAVMTITDTDTFGKKDAIKFATEIRSEYNEAKASSAGQNYVDNARERALSSNKTFTAEDETEALEFFAKSQVEKLINVYAYQYPDIDSGFLTNELAVKTMEDIMGFEFLNNLRDVSGLPAQTLAPDEELKVELPPLPAEPSDKKDEDKDEDKTKKEESPKPPKVPKGSEESTIDRIKEVVGSFTKEEWEALSRKEKGEYLGFNWEKWMGQLYINDEDYKGYVVPEKTSRTEGRK